MLAGFGAAAAAGVAGFTAWRDDPAPAPDADPDTLHAHAAYEQTAPAKPPAPITAVEGTFPSTRLRSLPEIGWRVERPAGVNGPLPYVLALHPINGNRYSVFGALLIMKYVAEYVRRGGQPFAVVSVNTGNNYYHPRAGKDGRTEDALAMIVDELLPRLQADPRLQLDHSRMALFGWSMGGYGALRLAGLLGPRRVRAVSAASPAIWLNPARTPKRAFDDALQFNEYSLLDWQPRLAQIPVQLSCGTADAFYAPTITWSASLKPPADVAFGPGNHGYKFWETVMDRHVAFLGDRLR